MSAYDLLLNILLLRTIYSLEGRWHEEQWEDKLKDTNSQMVAGEFISLMGTEHVPGEKRQFFKKQHVGFRLQQSVFDCRFNKPD